VRASKPLDSPYFHLTHGIALFINNFSLAHSSATSVFLRGERGK